MLSRRELNSDKVAGAVARLVIVGLAIYAVATWPFSYGYVRDVAMILAMVGAFVVFSQVRR